MMTGFEVAVVGGGLMGSSAARHLAEAGVSTVVIAAPEPDNWVAGAGPFASHYDSGRITRIISADPVWAELAVRSIGRYDDIAQRSGIEFHDPRGLAWLGLGIEAAVQNSKGRGGSARMVTPEWLYDNTGIKTPATADMQCAFEAAPAGVINPRNLAKAQLVLAEMAGATVITAAADAVQPTTRADDSSGVGISGAFGSVAASRVLLATGAYAADLAGIDLQVRRQLRTTVRIDLGPAPEMPSLIIEPVEHPHINDLYWNPPVRYPDGRVLFKVGCEIEHAPEADNADEIAAWFAGSGDPVEADALIETTRSLLPDARFDQLEIVPCVITRTTHKHPYIGWVDDRIAVALGGNGSSAKSCDELGRLASTLFSDDGWDDPILDAATFEPQLL